jgi:hypothetical protein
MDSANITDPLNIKFRVYTYITPDYEPGTLIVHPDLAPVFDSQLLFEMVRYTVCNMSLLDILHKGFIKIGDTDLMEKMDIEYPIIQNDTYKSNKIVGKHMYVRPAEIMTKLPNCQFDINNADDDSSHDLFASMSDSASSDVIDFDAEPIDIEPVDLTDSADSADSADLDDLTDPAYAACDTYNIDVRSYSKIDAAFQELDETNIIKDVTALLDVF